MRAFTLVLCAAGCFGPPAPTMMTTMTLPDAGPPAADLAPAHTPDLAPVQAQDLAGATTPDLANPSPPNVAALSDDFENGFQSNWNVFHSELTSISVDSGALVITPKQSLWFNDSEGPLVYKLVPTGDFQVTATVHARKASDASQAPDGIYSLGGLMARRSGKPENYVFIVIGHDGNDVSVEHKSTVDSMSTYTGPHWDSGDAELRICRVGTQMRLYKRTAGAAWTLALSVDRPDLAGELQVGALAYANTATPDLTIRYDEISFASACN